MIDRRPIRTLKPDDQPEPTSTVVPWAPREALDPQAVLIQIRCRLRSLLDDATAIIDDSHTLAGDPVAYRRRTQRNAAEILESSRSAMAALEPLTQELRKRGALGATYAADRGRP